jgi:tRNA(Ile)-lysidine synthetase-like protein
VTRIRQAVERGVPPRGGAVLAVSGGVDSMVLLDAVAAVRSRDVLVATFDHRTGPAAERAIDLVREGCAALGVPCAAGRAERPLETEAEFRDARWRFLRSTARGFDANAPIVTAHTADDQVETVCLRILRESGARGLAGLYARSDVVRPLIDVWREEIRAYAAARRLAWVEDPSNRSPRHARNRVRHDLLPAMRRVRPSIDAELLASARDAARWRDDVDRLVGEHVAPELVRGGIDVPAELLRTLEPIQVSILWPAIAARAGATLDRRGIERLARFSGAARVGAKIQLSGGWQVVRSRDAFQLRASSELKSPVQLMADAGGRWGDWVFRQSTGESGRNPWSATLPAGQTLTVRAWQPGDRMAARHGERGRSVKHFLSNAGITGHERGRWPVVLAGDQIVWVPGVRRSDAATARSGRPGLALVCERQSS